MNHGRSWRRHVGTHLRRARSGRLVNDICKQGISIRASSLQSASQQTAHLHRDREPGHLLPLIPMAGTTSGLLQACLGFGSSGSGSCRLRYSYCNHQRLNISASGSSFAGLRRASRECWLGHYPFIAPSADEYFCESGVRGPLVSAVTFALPAMLGPAMTFGIEWLWSWSAFFSGSHVHYAAGSLACGADRLRAHDGEEQAARGICRAEPAKLQFIPVGLCLGRCLTTPICSPAGFR